jgi:hypothetical protein
LLLSQSSLFFFFELYNNISGTLEDANPIWAKAPRILLLIAATKEALKHIKKETRGKLQVSVFRELQALDQAFHPKSKHWKGMDDERIEAKHFTLNKPQLKTSWPIKLSNLTRSVRNVRTCGNKPKPMIEEPNVL